MGVDVDRVLVVREKREPDVVGLRDGAAGRRAMHVADLEVFEKRTVGHGAMLAALARRSPCSTAVADSDTELSIKARLRTPAWVSAWQFAKSMTLPSSAFRLLHQGQNLPTTYIT